MILFHPKVEVIRSEAEQILGCAKTLQHLRERSPALEAFDLKRSARDLRDAADAIDQISAELKRRSA